MLILSTKMVKRCIRGLTFVLKTSPLKELALSRFVFSPKTKLTSKNHKFGKTMEVKDI